MNNRESKFKASMHERRRNRRAWLMGAFFILCFIGLLYRIWYWQTEHGDRLERYSIAQQARTQALGHPEIVAERGHITDRNFMPLAISRPVYTVFVDVRLATTRRNPSDRNLLQETITALHEAFDIPRDEVAAIFAEDAHGNLINDTHFFVIAEGVQGVILRPFNQPIHFRRAGK